MARILHWPDNIGVEFQSIRLPTRPETKLLAVHISGLAADELVRRWALEPLCSAADRRSETGPLAPGLLHTLLLSPRLRRTGSLHAVISGVLSGATALFGDGWAEALLIATERPATRPVGELVENVALLRKRLRDPALVAEPRHLPDGRAATAAVIYMEGRASPELIAQVRGWLTSQGGEEALRRGRTAGRRGILGLLPELLTSQWPDKAAAPLDVGYVVVLVDRIMHAFVAPVTGPAILYSPGDELLRRPVGGLLRIVRMALACLVLVLPGLVVALMNYHQEMVPAPFLLAMASTREGAPLPVAAEMFALLVQEELVRAAALRLPFRVTKGTALVASVGFVLLVVMTGLAGPLPALTTVGVSLATLALPGYDLAYLVHAWRYWILSGAVFFGIYGLTVMFFCFTAYLSQARSFGVPFLGPTGVRFTAPGRASSWRTGGRIREG